MLPKRRPGRIGRWKVFPFLEATFARTSDGTGARRLPMATGCPERATARLQRAIGKIREQAQRLQFAFVLPAEMFFRGRNRVPWNLSLALEASLGYYTAWAD